MQKIKDKISGSIKIIVTFLTMMAFSSSFYYAMESYSHKFNTKDNDKIEESINLIGKYQKDNEKEFFCEELHKELAMGLKYIDLKDLEPFFLDMSNEKMIEKIQLKISNSINKQKEINNLMNEIIKYNKNFQEFYEEKLSDYLCIEMCYYHELIKIKDKITDKPVKNQQ